MPEKNRLAPFSGASRQLLDFTRGREVAGEKGQNQGMVACWLNP
jgi:hypothetical protein